MTNDIEKTFADLGLRPEITETLSELGYEQPTPIQAATIPLLMGGGDVIGQAQTGTGKTAAFALPLLEKIDASDRATQALVLTPTRELAMQVAEAVHSYGKRLPHISVLPVYGGAPIVNQLKRLERGAQVVVGTPGRLIDHLDRGTLDLSQLKLIVLDEADEMLKMGFQEDVERILSDAAAERQVALFSATMPDEIIRISNRYLKNAQRVEVERHTLTAPAIEQRFLNLSEGQKLNVLTQILELEPSEGVLVFRRTKNGAAELAEKLEARGFPAAALHGDMTQAMRESVVRRLKSGQVEIVVATDVAARGLDVESLTHVVNYDIPYDVEAYVHRIGRTGRAGRSGVATLFITPRERRMMREIERYTGTQIKPMKMPTHEDVKQRRIEVFKDTVRKTLEEGDLDLYVSLVEELVDEGEHDITEVAAALARLGSGERAITPPPPVEPAPERTERVQREFSDRRPATPRAERPAAARTTAFSSESRSERKPRPGDDEPKVKLALSVGRNDGIRPADIVGSIANEADVPGREIGPIEIHDDLTVVSLPERYKDQVLEKTARAKFRGRALNVRVASEREADRPRPPRREESVGTRAARAYRGAEARERDDRSAGATERPRIPFKRRDDAAAPVRRAAPRDRDRDAGESRFVSRASRPGFAPSDRPARSFADRGERGAPKRDDRPARSYGDRDARPAAKRFESAGGRAAIGGYQKRTADKPAGAGRFQKRDDRGGAFSKFAKGGAPKKKR